MPTGRLMTEALATGDVAAALISVLPTHPDYAALRDELAATPAANRQRRQLIRANMDRWRWLQRDLGGQYLLTNVPEFQLRLTVNNNIIRTYRTIVGKPGRTATPQLAETVEGVIFNPTWTVPQSIVKGEGLGARVLGNPGWARANGYTATRGANGYVSVVQGSGPGNSLGQMKLDMPNPHAIFLHDTPARGLFANDNRALSHGCVRVERALELAMTIAILGQGATPRRGGGDLDLGRIHARAGQEVDAGLHHLFHDGARHRRRAQDLQRHLRPRRAGAGELQRAARRQPRAGDERGSDRDRRRPADVLSLRYRRFGASLSAAV